MLKTLLKKQFLETLSFFFMSGKKGSRRSTLVIVGVGLLMLYALGAVVLGIWALSDALIGVFLANDLGWAYFALFGGFATAVACISCVFAFKNRVFDAKDNDLLLSMPIAPWKILFVRVLSLYLLSLAIVALVFLPIAVRYIIAVGFSLLTTINLLVITLVLPLGALAVCGVIGWLIALISAKLPLKNVFIFLLLGVFLVFYFYVYTQINKILEYVLANSDKIGEVLQKIYPFWQMGVAATGNVVSLAIFAGIFLGAFAIVYLLLSKTFLSLITAKRGERKKKYVEKTSQNSSPFFAILKKEALRYLKKPLITLNCILGSILFIIFPIVALVNRETVDQILLIPNMNEIAVILTIILCFIGTSNMITSSSISLEGENLWILRAMPVSSWTVLCAKTAFHFLITGIPAVFCSVFMCVLLQIEWLLALLCVLTVCAMILLTALLGIFINLKLPNLHWTNEIVAVKQSLSTLLGMFSGWGISALLIGGYFLFGQYLSSALYLAICFAVLMIGAFALGIWLKKRGTEIFEQL